MTKKLVTSKTLLSPAKDYNKAGQSGLLQPRKIHWQEMAVPIPRLVSITSYGQARLFCGVLPLGHSDSRDRRTPPSAGRVAFCKSTYLGLVVINHLDHLLHHIFTQLTVNAGLRLDQVLLLREREHLNAETLISPLGPAPPKERRHRCQGWVNTKKSHFLLMCGLLTLSI